jgi:hypothetical protein
VTVGTGVTFTTGDVIDIALDAGGQLIWIRDNGGNWNGSGTANPATCIGGVSISAITGPYYAAIGIKGGNVGAQVTANFGATAYSFTAPAGFGNW